MNKSAELEYLMNPVLYDKYKQLSCKEDEALFKSDRQFYRKRINQMAKDALREKPHVPSQILKYYNEFARRCIEHFKCEDETECYQQNLGPQNLGPQNDFSNLDTIPNLENGFLDQNHLDRNLLGQTPKKKVVTMDNFVRKTNSVPQVPPIIPKQREINPKDKKYRTKGLRKNKKEI